MDKLLKITMVNRKILTLYKNFRETAVTWHALQKKENGCVPWMKRVVFHTSGVVGRETIHMGYMKQIFC